MRLEWIEDILAVVKAGSLRRAAEMRYLTQPAFSRRIRAIEDYVGIELVDRTCKPAQLRPAVLDQQERLETLASGLRNLLYDLRQQDRRKGNRIVIASQHAITTSIAPLIVKKLSVGMETTVRLRSANRDECFALLLSKQADLTLTYRLPDEELPLQGSFLEECAFGREELIPVFATHALVWLNEQYRKGEVPMILYPAEVFLGQVVNRAIVPKLRSQVFFRTKAETALTLAGLQLAREGVGVAWVPLSLASKEIAVGNLTDLSHLFRKASLSITAIRLAQALSPVEQDVWNILNELRKTWVGELRTTGGDITEGRTSA